MYTGVKAHHNVDPVASYADALQALEATRLTPKGRKRAEKPEGYPLGGHNKSVTWVRKDEDGSIAFQLYAADVVTWMPDNSVVVDNYGTVTTSGFAHRFLPSGIYLNYPTTRCGAVGGHSTIQFHDHVCCGGTVRFRRGAGGYWVPDEDTLDTMRFPELDGGAARELAKRYHFRDFAIWLETAPAHFNEPIHHAEWDLDECLTCLEERDFLNASRYLPLIDTGGFANDRIATLPFRTAHWRYMITMGSLQKLKLAARAKLEVSSAEFRTLPRREFDRRMARVRELARLGIEDAWGPQR
jgi:hypothetical protein